jgi:hypothetical protein
MARTQAAATASERPAVEAATFLPNLDQILPS